MNIKVKRFDKSLSLPDYEDGAACFDLLCREDGVIDPGQIKLVPANIAVKIPDGYVLMLFVRSSTPMKKGLVLANGVGIIDPYFCGEQDEVQIELWNITDKPVNISRGDFLAQGMLLKNIPVTWQEVDKMGETGAGGYRTKWKK